MQNRPFTRLQTVLNGLNAHRPGAPFSDEQISTVCPQCSTRQTLGETSVTADDTGTHYRCKNGCQDVVVVRAVPGGHTFWTATGLLVPPGSELAPSGRMVH